MAAGIVIILVSFVLLIYWFRYSCVLALRDGDENQADTRLAGQSRLRTGNSELGEAGSTLEGLHRSLDRDYQVFTYLIEHAAGLELNTLENRLLVWDYRLMRLWYCLTRSIAPQQARRALAEMGSVLHILFSRLGDRAGAHTAA